MKKWIVTLAAIIAAFGMLAPSADAAVKKKAGERPHYYIGPFDVGDPYVFVGGTIAGVGMLGAYYAIENNRAIEFGNRTRRVGGIRRHHNNFNGGAYALTTVGCMALSPMLASALVYANEGRMLSHREALGLGADCIIPFIGSMLWNAAYDAHPEWPGQ